ncbi:UDP-2,4-diacetamido-2,4,6-trideoxy-beta-L-altropyranose hydrolase [Reichenbachiella sp.]|uniref:UDP-2,4-diacetamido-2,4, 6-trideoxy-beta-L-altropyranose hydrolase n=1 Tax=Reichenbachiella sp. TaxID=2184521 RepID=UPI003BB137A1
MSHKKKIYFRADANAEIGMGHVIRSIALATMLKDEFSCTLYTRFPSSFIATECQAASIDLVYLKEKEGSHTNFLSSLSGDEIVVLDNYFFGTAFQKKIKSKGCALVCIDDLHEIHFLADLVINHNPAAKKQHYSVGQETRLLLGLDYVLLRKPFLNEHQRTANRHMQISTVFLCFGGSDLYGLTLKYMNYLLERTSYHVIAVLGNAVVIDELNLKIDEKRLSIHQGLNQSQMVDQINKSDLAIIPSSSILFEVIALKKPFVTGFYVENQKEISSHFASLDSRIVLGNLNEINVDKLQHMFTHFHEYPLDILDQIDGKSQQRYIEEFKSL